MKQFVTSITRGGQVTLPAEIRRILGVGPQGKVAFIVEDDEVRLVLVKYTLESAAGSVRPATTTEDLEGAIKEAKEEMAGKQAGMLRH